MLCLSCVATSLKPKCVVFSIRNLYIIIYMLDEIGEVKNVRAYIENRLKNKAVIWGLGHRELNEMNIQQAIKAVIAKQDLTQDEMHAVMTGVISRLTPAASKTSALPDLEETPRLPCLATCAPAKVR
jgi:hypothetical protein